MSENWDGKTKGGLTGYKIFVFLIRKAGINSAYFLLLFVAFWFVIFSRKATASQYYLFRKRLGFGFLKSVVYIYKNSFVFGQILIDKVAILSGALKKYTAEHTNSEVIENMIKNKTGGILVNAHMGSWQIAGQLLERYNGTIYILAADTEDKRIKNLLASAEGKNRIEIIPLKEDGSHIKDIHEVLKNKGILVMHGDRFTEGADTVEHEFLGEKAKFASGPFHLAAKYGVPVSFATAFREKNRHYHFYALNPIHVEYPGNIKKRKREIFEKSHIYVKELEKMLRKYPEQWFNFYNFWRT
ncbi:MAG: lysophospholipid acyltransferase family protein [Chlorobi bacterium]|nr:lysophospholipid acyltransferase family protein [Chlorobiota bacterium]